jgi:hypothetical protein
MNPVAVDVHRAGSMPRPGDLEADLARVKQIANLLDAQFEIAGFKFGWDAIIGLVPGVGDLAITAIGVYPLLVARKHGLGKWVQAKMIKNLALDFAVGAIPLAGDVFDAVFKAHLKNAAQLEQAVEKRRQRDLR